MQNRPPQSNGQPGEPSRPIPPSHSEVGTGQRRERIRRPVPESVIAARIRARKRAKRRRRQFIFTVALAGVVLLSIILVIVAIASRASAPGGDETNRETESGPIESGNALPPGETGNNPGETDAQTTPPVQVDPNAPVICIDPGHGYGDGGTSSEFLAPFDEKDINLAIALKLRDMLTAEGYRVVMTRDSDIVPDDAWFGELLDPNERIEFLEDLDEVDYFVSLHCNSFTGEGRAWGTRLYYYTRNGEETPDFVQSIADGIYERLPAKEPRINAMSSGAFAVTRHQICPAVLIEVGFVTDSEDAANMKDEAWQASMARGISNGLSAYIRSKNTELS